MKFFKDSIREIKHVVWPTRKETRTYFIIVLTVLILFGIYLFIFSTIFSEGLLYLKKLVSGESNYSINIDPEQLGLEILTWEVETIETWVNEVVEEETEVVSSWDVE